MGKKFFLTFTLGLGLILGYTGFSQAGCCGAVVVTGFTPDTTLTTVGTVGNAVINEEQYDEIVAQLAAIDASVKGQISQMTGTLQEVLKFNNTSLIESMKDIEKSKKIIEAKEHISSVSQTLCDEPGVAAGYQTAIKAGEKISKEFAENITKQVMNSDELEIKKMVANLELDGTKPETAFDDTLDERGTVHYMNKVMSQNQAYAMPKLDENFNYSDPNAKLALEYERNKRVYELARKTKADSEFAAKHGATMPITPEIRAMMENINIDPDDEKYKSGKISVLEFMDIKASQFTADPDKAKEDITRNEAASLGEMIRLMSYQLHLQIYQTKILERIQDKLLEIPTGSETKENIVQ